MLCQCHRRAVVVQGMSLAMDVVFDCGVAYHGDRIAVIELDGGDGRHDYCTQIY